MAERVAFETLAGVGEGAEVVESGRTARHWRRVMTGPEEAALPRKPVTSPRATP